MSVPYGLSEKYWNALSPAHQGLYGLVRPMPDAVYTVDPGIPQRKPGHFRAGIAA